MKKIAQMKKDELLLVTEEYEIEADESMTNQEIRDAIADAGIDDDFLKEAEDDSNQESASGPAETEDEVLIRMMVPTQHYQYGNYKFSRNDPFAVMKKEHADAILESNGDLFRKASEDEIRKFYA